VVVGGIVAGLCVVALVVVRGPLLNTPPAQQIRLSSTKVAQTAVLAATRAMEIGGGSASADDVVAGAKATPGVAVVTNLGDMTDHPNMVTYWVEQRPGGGGTSVTTAYSASKPFSVAVCVEIRVHPWRAPRAVVCP
jgi:hypothetical protein